MRQKQSFNIAACLGFAIALIWIAAALAEVTWYFNWYCSGCARIGARTTGTEGPFSSQSACEGARSGMQSTMDRRGGGVRAENCYSVGFEAERPSPSTSSPPSSGGGGYRQPQSPQFQQPAFDLEQQRREEEERRHREEEAERVRQAEIERQQQEKFRRARDEAVKSLRGGDSAPLGIRGNPTGDLQIRGLPEQTPRSGTDGSLSAWKQLYCVSNIFQGVLGGAKEGNLDEMHYLAQEMKNALDSRPLGVDCGQTPEPPAPYGQKELPRAKMLAFYQKLMDATLREGAKLKTANEQLEEAKKRETAARERLENLRNPSARREDRPSIQEKTGEKPSEKPREKAQDDPIARAYEQQKAFQEKESKKIEEVYKKQKEKQGNLDEAMALLRESQRQLNEVNSRKTEATNALNRYGDMSNQVIANPGRAGELEQMLTQRRK